MPGQSSQAIGRRYGDDEGDSHHQRPNEKRILYKRGVIRLQEKQSQVIQGGWGVVEKGVVLRAIEIDVLFKRIDDHKQEGGGAEQAE